MDAWAARDRLNEYKAWYQGEYNHRPSEKLQEEFCRLHGIPWPVPKPEVLEAPGEDFWRENLIDG